MLRMVSTSKGRKILQTRSTFHRFETWSLRAETIRKSSKLQGALIALYVEAVGSHLSSQMWMILPLPTCHLEPLWITFRLLWILRQAYEGLLPNWASRTSEWGKYFAFYILEIKESGLVRSLQACLASMARLKAWRFLNPIPPWSFDLYIFFQATQAIFFSF